MAELEQKKSRKDSVVSFMPVSSNLCPCCYAAGTKTRLRQSRDLPPVPRYSIFSIFILERHIDQRWGVVAVENRIKNEIGCLTMGILVVDDDDDKIGQGWLQLCEKVGGRVRDVVHHGQPLSP